MTVVLNVLSLLVGVSILGFMTVLLRKQSNGGVEEKVTERLDQIQMNVQLLDEQMSASTKHQSDRFVEIQEVLDRRFRGFTEQVADDSVRQAKIDSTSRQELQMVLSDRLQKMEGKVGDVEKGVNTGLNDLRTTNASELEKIRAQVAEKLQTNLAASLKENSSKVDELRVSMGKEMEKIRTGNETQLEKMRATVDEKLQGTLEKRLGDSFKMVSERLEQVQRGLGEMQTLANDVGGLKRVLTNVKSRGTWGEVLLERQLEDVMTEGQYEKNVEVQPGSGERVEFAVVLPGKEDKKVFLPVDSKFPQKPYERLLDAQKVGDKSDTDLAVKELERAIKQQAKLIKQKYVVPPLSTDFAVMYLPTEGLFAEVMRIPGLAAELQQTHRIVISGPTTLMLLLNSLQMGFRTLAIEKRSSEVWAVLSGAKGEFDKYCQVWEKLGRQLETANKTVKEVGVRSRAVERELREVEKWQHKADGVKEDILISPTEHVD